MRFWHGPWEWDTGPPVPHWRPPAGAIASYDGRNETECSAPGPVPQGWGLFGTADGATLPGYTNLGTDPDRVLSGIQKTQLQTLLRLPAPIQALDLSGAIWEALTIQADPSGIDRSRPVVPTTGRRFEFHFGPFQRFQAFRSDRPEWTPVIDQLKREYRRIRQACLDGELPAIHYKKVCGYWVRKYGLPYRIFQPSDLPDEPSVEPTTTITESFNTADSDTLGPDLTWSEVAGDWDVVSNECRMIGNNLTLYCRAQSDLSSEDHYSQAMCTALGTGVQEAAAGVCTRFAAAASTFYMLAYVYQADNKMYMYKVVATVFTELPTAATITPSIPEIYKGESNGSTHKGYQAGVERRSVTDTAITGNLRCGLSQYHGSGIVTAHDAFEAADLAAAPSAKPYYYHHHRRVAAVH